MKPRGFTLKQLKFIDKYLETGNITKSAIYAGYSEKSAHVTGCNLLKNNKIASEMLRRREDMAKESIADAEEVMAYFTRVMRGEEKDQFGLDATLADRTKAAQELARRTIDIENKIKGVEDNTINIVLDWNRE